MNWELIISIASIVVTIVISLLLHNSRKYPGGLSVSLINLYRVLGKKPDHYANLSLNLGDYQIENNLLYVKLILFNEKSFDISATTSESRVTMLFPDTINWVDLHEVKHASQLNVDVSINNFNPSEASIGFSLLKQGESIILEGLIETKEEYTRDSLLNQIQFHHRIPNVGNITKVYCPPEISGKWRATKILFTTFFAVAICLFAFKAIYNDNVPLRYIDQISRKSVAIALNKDSELVVYPKTWTRGGSYIVSEDYFKEHFVPDRTYNRNYEQTFAIVCISLLLLAILLGDWEYIKETRTRKKLSKYI